MDKDYKRLTIAKIHNEMFLGLCKGLPRYCVDDDGLAYYETPQEHEERLERSRQNENSTL